MLRNNKIYWKNTNYCFFQKKNKKLYLIMDQTFP